MRRLYDGSRTWAAMTVMVTMMMRSATVNNGMLTAAMGHASRAVGVRMMPVAVAATATVVVMMIMFFTVAECLGRSGGHIHVWNS